MSLVSPFLQPNMSQAVQLLQGHEVDAALNPPLINLRRLSGKREGFEAGEKGLKWERQLSPQTPLAAGTSRKSCHKGGSALR